MLSSTEPHKNTILEVVPQCFRVFSKKDGSPTTSVDCIDASINIYDGNVKVTSAYCTNVRSALLSGLHVLNNKTYVLM